MSVPSMTTAACNLSLLHSELVSGQLKLYRHDTLQVVVTIAFQLSGDKADAGNRKEYMQPQSWQALTSPVTERAPI